MDLYTSEFLPFMQFKLVASPKKDLEEVPKELRRGLRIVLIDKMTDVLRRALIRG